MGVTRLKRKARRNKQTAAKRQNSIKQLTSKPVLKKIDKDAAKAAFGTPVAETKPEAVAEPEVEQVEETTAEAVEAAEVEAVAEETVETEEVEAPEASEEEAVSDEVESETEEASEEGEEEE